MRATRLLMHLASVGVLLCLALQATADTSKGVGWGFQAFAVTGQVADGVTTIGQRELNPVMKPIAGKPVVLLASKAALGGGIAWLGDWLSRKGHPRAGKALCLLAGGAGWGMAAHNVGRR